MEQLYPNNCELSARAAFYDSLSSLQAELLSEHNADATLLDALRLMPQHGFAWFLICENVVLAHCKGHKETAPCECSSLQLHCLASLLGDPQLLGLILKPTEESKPTTSPAPAVTSIAQAVTTADPGKVRSMAMEVAQQAIAANTIESTPAAAPAPDPAHEPEAATEVDPSHSHEPLTKEDKQLAIGIIQSLYVAPRKKFVAAFRAAFDIPQEQQVSAAITEVRHLVFVQRFVSEAEGVPMP